MTQQIKLPDVVLAQIRLQAETAFTDSVSFYEVSNTYSIDGTPITASGLYATVPCLVSDPSGKENELIANLRSAGLLKQETVKILVPFGTNLHGDLVAVISGVAGNDWEIVSTNENLSNQFQLYSRAILTRDKIQTDYRKQY